MNKGEIVIYQTAEDSVSLKVRVEDDTVWLTQAQMVVLFNSTKQNISLHINNIFKEGELQKDSVVKEYLTTASDGKKYRTKFYSLDVIISVGYRVKSLRGTQFRIWANKVLKDYLLKGYTVNQRIDRIENDVHYLKEKVNEFDLQIKTSLPPNEGVFFNGQVFDAYVFVTNIIKTAKESIVLIDNYVNENTLLLLAKRNKEVSCIIFTAKIDKQLKLDLQKHNQQYPKIEIRKYSKSHDRFLIIDNKTIYHIGASLKDLGQKWFAFSNINLDALEMLKKLEHNSNSFTR